MVIGRQPALTLKKKTVLLEKILLIMLEELPLKLLPKSVSRSENEAMIHYN